MADAIDREQHPISPAHEARQQPRAVFDTAVVMEKACADALDHKMSHAEMKQHVTEAIKRRKL